MYISPAVTTGPRVRHVTTRKVSFQAYNDARRAIARTLDFLEADALTFEVDGVPQLVRWEFGAGAK